MDKYVSRKKHKAGYILLFIFPILALIGSVVNSMALILFSLLLAPISALFILRTSRCPYCGESFRGLYWEKPNAGFCRRCGKLIEFDDFADPEP